MTSVLILEKNGNFVEKNIENQQLKDLLIDQHLEEQGLGSVEILLKIPYLDKKIIYLGWSKGTSDQENLHKIPINFKKIRPFGDIIVTIQDHENNYYSLTKNSYLNEFIPFALDTFKPETEKADSGESDIEEYENNLDKTSTDSNKFNLNNYITHDFI